MTGLDTNVLVRLLTGDDPEHQATALAAMHEYCTAEAPGWINRIVAVELVWVLSRAYGYSREQIAATLDRLLLTAEIAFEDRDEVRTALAAYRDGGDFADALLGERNAADGCATTITFDRAAASRLGTRFRALA